MDYRDTENILNPLIIAFHWIGQTAITVDGEPGFVAPQKGVGDECVNSIFAGSTFSVGGATTWLIRASTKIVRDA